LRPDAILIEGPPDADGIIKHLANERLEPPVAMLVYHPKDFSKAAYYPFAEFSPEWQAMKYAIQRNTHVQFMDLPRELSFALTEQDESLPPTLFNEVDEDIEPTDEQAYLLRDPLAYLSNLAGYTDSERWWEIMFEQEDNAGSAIFETILDMMCALRDELKRPESKETLLREAYMRKVIRQAKKEGYQNIAIVCGAWHSPVLHRIDQFKESHDAQILKGLKKISTESTWIPWTYDRLSTASGYGAGVVSPAWYAQLFENRTESLTRWMVNVAQLLRAEDLNSSSAHAIEAVRLAETLATMRNRTIAGMDEMHEAALSIFCGGYEAPMQLIRQKLIIGDKMGKVPPEIPQVPLQKDVEASIKTARLSKEYGMTTKTEKELDLRKDTNRLASELLHRLRLLDIPWGKPMAKSAFQLGNFKENWLLHWQPEYALNLIQAGIWGNTIYDAACRFVKHQTEDVQDLPKLTELIQKSLDASLSDVIPILLKKLQDLSALTTDTMMLMGAVPPLVEIVRYGNTRKTDASAVEQVLTDIIPRICLGLPSACHQLDDESAALLFDKLQKLNRAIYLLENQDNIQLWQNALARIGEMDSAHGSLSGLCTRTLFDKEIWSISVVSQRMGYALSHGNDLAKAAHWMEGFLAGSGLVLIHHPELWQILDGWVTETPHETILLLLPLLRRTFSKFAAPERQKMLELAKTPTNTGTSLATSNVDQNQTSDYDKERKLVLLTGLKIWNVI
jgi:hypothetical protein